MAESIIDLKVTGAEQAAKDLKKVADAEKELAKQAKEAKEAEKQAAQEQARANASAIAKAQALGSVALSTVQGLAGSVVQSIVTGINSFTDATSHFRELNFKDAKDEAKSLDESLTRLSLRGREGIDSLKQKTIQLSERIGVSAANIAQAATMLSDATYSDEGMTEGAEAMGKAANESGRKMEQLLPLAGALGKAFGASSKQIGSGFEKIKDLAQILGTTGGVRAFQDTIAGLGPQMQQLGIQTDEARDRMLAFVGVITKGLNKDQAQQVGAQALTAMQSVDPARLLRTLHQTWDEVYDEKGRMRDPINELKLLKKKTIGRFGKERGRLVAAHDWGPMLASALYNNDLDEADKIAQQKPLPQEPTYNFTQTPAGGRALDEVMHQNDVRREEGSNLLKIADDKRRYNMANPEARKHQIWQEKSANYLPDFMAKWRTRYFESMQDPESQIKQKTLEAYVAQPMGFFGREKSQKQIEAEVRAEYQNSPEARQAAAEISIPDRPAIGVGAPAKVTSLSGGESPQVQNSLLIKKMDQLIAKTASAPQIVDAMKNGNFRVHPAPPSLEGTTKTNKKAGDVNK